MARLSHNDLSDFFALHEFIKIPRDAFMQMYPREHNNLKLLAKELDVVRREIGRPIRISSGFRTVLENQRAKGSRNSYHLRGMAADIFVLGMPTSELFMIMDRLMHQGFIKKGGLRLYPTFVHYDIRGKRTTW